MSSFKHVNPIYRIEADKLAKGLLENSIEFYYYDCWDGVQIVCDGWDAICHSGSYGHEQGLLEIMGTIVRADDDDVEGWLTAEEILQRLNLTA